MTQWPYDQLVEYSLSVDGVEVFHWHRPRTAPHLYDCTDLARITAREAGVFRARVPFSQVGLDDVFRQRGEPHQP